MEPLTLLSGATASALLLATHAEVATTTATTVTLGGKAHGVYLAHRIPGSTIPGGTESVGDKIYDFLATGKPTPIGAAAITGNLQVFDISSGPPNGTLKLITSKGTLTLAYPRSVEIPEGVPSPTSPHEIVDTYFISKGTGAYEGDTGSGVVEFTLKAGHTSGNIQTGQVDIKFTTLLKTTNTA